MKQLINRIKAKETALGNILAYYLPTIVVINAIIIEIVELPVPFFTKEVIGYMTIASIILGKLTKAKDV